MKILPENMCMDKEVITFGKLSGSGVAVRTLDQDFWIRTSLLWLSSALSKYCCFNNATNMHKINNNAKFSYLSIVI